MSRFTSVLPRILYGNEGLLGHGPEQLVIKFESQILMRVIAQN